MSITAEKRPRGYRAEQLLEPGAPEKFAEIIEGELVVMTPADKDHNRIASNFELLFRDFCGNRPDLDYGGDNDGFRLQRSPDVLLSPDASLYLVGKGPCKPWLEFAPDIAVEVLSPSNSAALMAYKRGKYFAAGAEQVWIAELETKTIEFWFADGRRVIVQGDEVIKGEGIAAGLEIDLNSIFAVRNQE